MEFQTVHCKCCGAVLDLTKMAGQVVRCDYCGGTHILARSDRAKNFLDQGEHDLDTCRFEEAFSAYEKAAEIDGKEPEAWFGMAAARFKIQFLKDEVNNRLQPICHAPSDKTFYDDECFRKALALATEEQKREYKKRGREIDEINEEFYALKKSGLTYDCFLCAKVTEEDGRTRTSDYERANDIYYYLKDEGYKPFFSEREMKGRTGSDYEALILYALSVSECMLIVCSDEKYLQTKWVKNEYTRFMSMIANEEKARDALTFVFCGTPVEKLPNGKKIQGVDYSAFGASDRIKEFVRKHASLKKEPPASTPAPISAESAEELYQEGKAFYEAKEFGQAAIKYRLAAEMGCAEAQCGLGNCYDNGQGVPRNCEEAANWFRKAAEQGLAKAQYNLGICYDNGNGVPQRYEDAAKWYQKAAEQGYVNAQYNFGLCYKNGQGVPKNHEEAAKWFRKAAEQGNAKAQYNLGVCYYNGQGVPKNREEAVRWLKMAASQGEAYAKSTLKQLGYSV